MLGDAHTSTTMLAGDTDRIITSATDSRLRALIELKVSFHATIRDAAGVHEAEIEATSVRGLLDRLREMFGAQLFNLLVDKGNLREDVVILINGKNILLSGGIDTPLSASDDVAIFPPVSGG